MSGPRPSVRRKIAVATWRAPKEGRLHARMAVDATAVLDFCAVRTAESGVRVTPGVVVGMAFARGVQQVPAFHARVVLGMSRPAACASSFTASMNGRPLCSVIHRIASPCAPQPKQ